MMGLLATVTAQAYDFEKDGIFYNVTSLEDLTVEVTNEEGNYHHYSGNIIVPETVDWNERTFTVTAIGDDAFSQSDITSINMPISITRIGSAAFSHCDQLDSIAFPESVTYIEGQAFCECERLKSVVFPKNLETIGFAAFEKCDSLKGIVLPDNLKYIDGSYIGTFENCMNLSSVTLPGSLINIGENTFKGCIKLDTVIVKSSTPYDIDESVFPTETYFNGTLFVPQNSKSVYQNAAVWKNFTNIVETDYADPTVCKLTVVAHGEGEVNFLGQSVRNGKLEWNVEKNSEVDILANPDFGYKVTVSFPTDDGPGSSVEDLTYFSAQIGEDPVTVEVTFTKIPVTLTVQQGESGYVEVEAEYGQTRNVRIMPYEGWYVNSVTLDGMDYTYMLDAENQFTTPELYSNAYLNVDLQPYFTPSPVTLTIQQAESGCVEMEAEYGKTNTIRITPYEGWYINSVTLDGTDYTYMLDAENRFTTPELYSNAFLNVAFEQYNSDGVRGISADGTKVYAQEGRLVIDQTTPGSLIRIYDESGREMKSFTADESRMEITLPANHVYIVKTPQKSVKIKL